MKKILAIILALCMVLSLAACGGDKPQGDPNQGNNQQTDPNQGNNQQTDPNQGGKQEDPGKKDDKPAFEISVEKLSNGERVTFSRMATSAEDFKKTDFQDEFVTAALTIMAFCLYETNPDEALAALEYINGPNELGALDKSHYKEQFSQYPYVARSYLDGATPENSYKVDKYSVTFTENSYSRQEKGIARLYVKSGGADSERVIQLRQKESTGEWFLNNCNGILAGIRNPGGDAWK